MKPFMQVCGDPTVDWLRIHNEDTIVKGGVYYWQKQTEFSSVRLSSKLGGSALVTELLREIFPPDSVRLEGVIIDEELLNRPKDGRITTSWTSWREFPNPDNKQSAFRLADWHEFEPGDWDYSSAILNGSPDLLIVWDSDLGFRTHSDCWPEILSSEPPQQQLGHIIYKLGQYNDGQTNPLLERISELGYSERTSIISSLSDLRACAVKIGISLSWERMLEEVVQAVHSPNCPFINPAGQLKYHQVIVPIDNSAAIIVKEDSHILIFDRSGQEGDFSCDFPGQMIGDNTCIVVALAASWAENGPHTDWIKACFTGIELARFLQIQGYDVVERGSYKNLDFPSAAIARAYHELKAGRLVAEDFPYNDRISNMGLFIDEDNLAISQTGRWTILENALLKQQVNDQYLPDYQSIMAVNACARDIVTRGPQAALMDVPIETIGGWYSADRQEIEGVRSVSNAMRDYLKQNSSTPLCVAVFGPPGAGKSFAIKEIAKGLGIENDAQLTFNLSQFESPRELHTAFHQIRDLNLRGKLPLVFWDEFDTPCEGRPWGWLRYFLAPMQDGEFTDQGITHPLGNGIFVFAGATRHSYEEFRSGNLLADRNAKKPDFISRLRAYINIRGINANPNTVEDRLYMVRRAFILRQYLEANVPQIQNNNQFEVESGVLDAFLMVNKYWHGTRSLENLLKMSSLLDKRKYELSSLPPDQIIDMHTNINEFHDLVINGHRKTIRIGITSHIDLDPQDIVPIQKGLQRVINFITEQFPDHNLTVFSSLTAWADRMLARTLLNGDASRLIAVLPWPQDEFMTNLLSADEAIIEQMDDEILNEYKYWHARRAIEIIEMPSSPTRKAAYAQAANYIAENSDIMLLLWNGELTSKPSITASNWARADKLNKPICHIWANTRQNKLSSSPTQVITGKIRVKNFPGQPVGQWLNLR